MPSLAAIAGKRDYLEQHSVDKHAIQSVVIAITALLLAPFAALRAAEAPARSAKPNIVLIISDDHAWTDYSFMGHPRIATPAGRGVARRVCVDDLGHFGVLD